MNTRIFLVSTFLILTSSFAWPAILPPLTSSNYNIYLSPAGSDSNTGLSSDSPLLTLSQAQKILKAQNPQQNVKILVAPGRYLNQRTIWDFVRPNFNLSIEGQGTTKPIFDGCSVANPTDVKLQCAGGTFFILNAKNGQPSNLYIKNLQIQNYWMGISLNGDYKVFSSYNWNNTISNNVFFNVGNGWNSALSYSYAAIRLYNSRNNFVTNNSFYNIVNLDPYDGYIHAIYAASWASSNSITYNTFENVSGDVIRIRDTSNYTWVGNNTFIRAGLYAAMSDWYCSGTSCDKFECPSWENKFSTNTWGLNYSGQYQRMAYASGSSVLSGCSAPSSTSSRISSSSNVFTVQ